MPWLRPTPRLAAAHGAGATVACAALLRCPTDAAVYTVGRLPGRAPPRVLSGADWRLFGMACGPHRRGKRRVNGVRHHDWPRSCVG